MRRRVARLLRGGLLVVGLSLVAWYPLSWYIVCGIRSSWPHDESGIYSSDGNVSLVNLRGVSAPAEGVHFVFVLERNTDGAQALRAALVPTYLHSDTARYHALFATIPLWLLAFICLAWPVTSFILARRRHKRGFPVEVKPPEAAVPPSPGGG